VSHSNLDPKIDTSKINSLSWTPNLQHTFVSSQKFDDTNHYILTGSFRSLSLFLLAFSPSARTLTKVKRIPGEFGPHQYLAKVDHGSRSDANFGETKKLKYLGLVGRGHRCCIVGADFHSEWRLERVEYWTDTHK
jgi:hypothetical protein